MGTAPEYQRKMLDAVVVLEGVQALRREAAAVAAAARDTCESSQALRAEATQAGRHAADLLWAASEMTGRAEELLAEARTHLR